MQISEQRQRGRERERETEKRTALHSAEQQQRRQHKHRQVQVKSKSKEHKQASKQAELASKLPPHNDTQRHSGLEQFGAPLPIAFQFVFR